MLFFLLIISNKICDKVLIQTINDFTNFKHYLRSSSEVMADREKWRGGQREYIENEKSFLDEINSGYKLQVRFLTRNDIKANSKPTNELAIFQAKFALCTATIISRMALDDFQGGFSQQLDQFHIKYHISKCWQ